MSDRERHAAVLTSAAVDNELTPTERDHLSSRLAADPTLANLHSSLTALAGRLRRLAQPPLPSSLADQITARLDDADRNEQVAAVAMGLMATADGEPAQQSVDVAISSEATAAADAALAVRDRVRRLSAPEADDGLANRLLSRFDLAPDAAPAIDVDEELLSAAVDGELTVDEVIAVEEAVAASPELAAELAVYQALRGRVRGVRPDLAPPADLWPTITAGLDRLGLEPAQPRRSRPVAAPRRWSKALSAIAVAACLLAVLPGLRPPRVPVSVDVATAPAPVPAWEFDADLLLAMHARWHERIAGQAPESLAPAQMADQLSERVGYEVRPPDPKALGARLTACTTCSTSFSNGQRVALFLLHDEAGANLSLFEVKAPAAQVHTAGFRPYGGGVAATQIDGTGLAVMSDGEWHTCLVADGRAAADVARLVPRALTIADVRQPLQLVTVPGR